ncbi:dysbindin-A isoform X3 [Nothobranchius furzeri]|uniref:dysbindin-A isoform X3 n=1 Tax=Nothobranchius furzeri TaxID=105023 RepID=UPI00390488E6
MFENFRERLHMVQQDFSTGFKTLGDKSRDSKMKRRSRLEEGFPHFSAGLDILSRYEKSWFLLHRRTKDCAQLAESVDGDIVMLSAHWERKRAALKHLQEQLQTLPDLISELDAITANIVELTSEHAQKVAELELAVHQKLRERQKVYEEAFNQDMERYISTGCLQNKGAPNRECEGPQIHPPKMRRRRGELQVPEIQALPQNAGTPRRLQPGRPPPPSRGTEDRPGGPQPAAGRVPGDISGKATGPPAASHPLAGRARDPATRDPATRDPGATTPAGDPAEPRDPDPTRQPPGSNRQMPKS